MTSDDDAFSWRDLADQLTLEQVEELEREEQTWEDFKQSRSRYIRNVAPSIEEQQRQLLAEARRFILAVPPDATHVESWRRIDGVWFRDFNGGAWLVGAAEVTIEGRQYADGRCRSRIILRLSTSRDSVGPGNQLPDHPLTPAEARELAQVLRAAADRVERYSQDGDASAGSVSKPDLVYRGFRGVVVRDPKLPPGNGWSPLQARELATAIEEAAIQQSPDWKQIGISEGRRRAAVAVFQSSELATRWLELLVRLGGKSFPQMVRWDDYLQSIPASGLSPEQFEQWFTVAGTQLWNLPRDAKSIIDAGLGIEDLKRWRAAGGQTSWLPRVLEHLSFDEAIELLPTWGTEYGADYELSQLLGTGTAAHLQGFIADGLTGHEVYEWSCSGIPANEWLLWKSSEIQPVVAAGFWKFGVPPEAARELYAAGMDRPEIARRWMDTCLPLESTVAYIRLGCSPEDGVAFARFGVQPQDLWRSPKGLQVAKDDLGLVWTDLFAPPRSSSPVFAVHRHIVEGLWPQTSPLFKELSARLHQALNDLGSYGASAGRICERGCYGLAFLDGGWAKRVPDGLDGPVREWIVGVDALALLCSRLRAQLPRTGRFRSVPSGEELEARWEVQRRDDTDVRARSGLLVEAGSRPHLEELASRLRSPEPYRAQHNRGGRP